MIFGLLAMCLIPRAVMAWKLGGLCPDGVYYVRLAQSLDQGNVAQAIQQSRLNPLPIALVLLHRAGLDWELAGNLWGVLWASAGRAAAVRLAAAAIRRSRRPGRLLPLRRA